MPKIIHRSIRVISTCTDNGVEYKSFGVTIPSQIAENLSGLSFYVFQNGSDIICKAVIPGRQNLR